MKFWNLLHNIDLTSISVICLLYYDYFHLISLWFEYSSMMKVSCGFWLLFWNNVLIMFLSTLDYIQYLQRFFIELSFRQTMAYTYINRNLMLIGISLFVYHAVSYKLDEDAFVFPGKKHISFHQKGMKMLKSYFVRTAI